MNEVEEEVEETNNGTKLGKALTTRIEPDNHAARKSHASSSPNNPNSTSLLLNPPNHLPLPRTPRISLDPEYRTDPRLVRVVTPLDTGVPLVRAPHRRDGRHLRRRRTPTAEAAGSRHAAAGRARAGAAAAATAPRLLEDDRVRARAVVGRHGGPEGGAMGGVDGGQAGHVDGVGGRGRVRHGRISASRAARRGEPRAARGRGEGGAVEAEGPGDLVGVAGVVGVVVVGTGREGRDGHAGAGGRHGAAVGGGCHQRGAVGVVLGDRGRVAAGRGGRAGDGGGCEG